MGVSNKKAFTLLETLIALSILLLLLPQINNFFHTSIKRYLSYSEENKESAQIFFAEFYLKKISKNATSMNNTDNVLNIISGGTNHEVGVKNNKLYTMQTATRYLTVEPMIIASHKIVRLNDKYYQIELKTHTNRKYLIQVIRY